MTFLTFSVKMTLNTRGYNSVWSPEGSFSRAAAASYIASMFVASLYVRKVAPLSVKNWQKLVTTWVAPWLGQFGEKELGRFRKSEMGAKKERRGRVKDVSFLNAISEGRRAFFSPPFMQHFPCGFS